MSNAIIDWVEDVASRPIKSDGDDDDTPPSVPDVSICIFLFTIIFTTDFCLLFWMRNLCKVHLKMTIVLLYKRNIMSNYQKSREFQVFLPGRNFCFWEHIFKNKMYGNFLVSQDLVRYVFIVVPSTLQPP